MNVAPEHAAAFANLNEHGEIPLLDAEMTEFFGPWFCNNAGGFWSHDPETGLLKSHGQRYHSSIEPVGLSREDSIAHARKVESLHYLAPPEIPADTTIVHREKSFIYEGFVFQRIFIPELGRWEMISFGRHIGIHSGVNARRPS